MIQAKCIQKFRDKKNKIYGYRLQDINGQTQDVTPNDLKNAILNKQIVIVNLTLTTDGRLVDKTPEKQLQNKKIMPNTVKDTTKELEDMADMIANKIYNKLKINETAKEIKCLNNNYDGNIDQRYEPEIKYKGNEAILVVTIYPKDKKVWLALENIDADDSYLEMDSTINEVDKLIDKFTSTILYKSDKHSKITERPYDADSYTEFIKRLIPLIENTFKFNGEEKFAEGDISIDDTTRDITWLCGCMGDFIYNGYNCYIEIDYSYDVDSKDGVLTYDVMIKGGDDSPQYSFKYEFDSINMKAHFSKILKETQKFIYYIMNNWEYI